MILDSRARYQEQSAKDILEEILKDTEAPKVEENEKQRFLLLIWFILLALAAVFTRAWVYSASCCFFICPCGSGVFAAWFFLRKKDHYEAKKLPKAAEQDGIWKGKLQIANESVLPVFLGKGSLHLENHFTGEKMELPFSFSLKEKGKTIDFKGKAGGAAVFTPPYTPGAPMIFHVHRAKKGRLGCPLCTVVMPCEQKEDFRFLTKRVFDMESFPAIPGPSGDDPGDLDIREYQEGDGIRQIHWKLTGKLDKMMIRQRSFPVDDTVLILAEPFLKEKAPAVAQTLE
ncbi:MAG: DUF58 domain-containing protein [Blautia faecis]